MSGRFTTRRYVAFALLVGLYAVLPWIRVGGAPALFIDIDARRLYVLGATFNAQDTWLLFFLLTGAGFGLIFVTTLLGRIWCGYACPQTVFLEGVFRRIERFIEGPREQRLRLDRAAWSSGKVARKAVKHALYVAASLLISHLFVSYFVSLPRLFEMVRRNPAEHPEAFAWMAALTTVIYFNFSWFREQLCLVVCPYGRLQSALMDDDTRLVGYEERRGEPRGKRREPSAGDCVDCKRCVVVCPTGIDIRNGAQIECVGCAACIDACDAVMLKLGRDPGLIRYDSLAGLAGKESRWLRPRIGLYGVLGLIGLAVAVTAAHGRSSFEVNVLRQAGAPFVVSDGAVRNALTLHLVNKSSETRTFTIAPDSATGMEFILPRRTLELGSMKGFHLPVFVTLPSANASPGQSIRVKVSTGSEYKTVSAPFVTPHGHGAEH